jgi:hypothetical protein
MLPDLPNGHRLLLPRQINIAISIALCYTNFMETIDTRRLSPQAQFEIRKQVIRLRKRGFLNKDIAAGVGISVGSASKIWRRIWRNSTRRFSDNAFCTEIIGSPVGITAYRRCMKKSGAFFFPFPQLPSAMLGTNHLLVNYLIFLEPMGGIEPPTCRLRID